MKAGGIAKSESRLLIFAEALLQATGNMNNADSDSRFQTLWKDLHTENRAINSQPPTSANYLLRMYPKSLERDALLQEHEVMWDYKWVFSHILVCNCVTDDQAQ
jgi:hypothetical protein